MKRIQILLKTLLKSTSQRNILRYSGDEKKRKKIYANIIGYSILHVILAGYSLSIGFGYGAIGIHEATPVICALLISALAFLLTLFKTNGYLFNFKEYDMLMALPFEARTVAACKFLYMYVKSLSWYFCISLSMMLGYGFFVRPHAASYVLWILLSFFLPIIPMLAASFLGFLIAWISARFQRTNIVQTILTFLFVVFCFSLRYIIDALVRKDEVVSVMEQTSRAMDRAAGIYLPAKWFADAVSRLDVAGLFFLVVVSVLLFGAVFALVGNAYRRINSALKSHAASKRYRRTALKKRGVIRAIAFKEYRRMVGSSIYLINGTMGEFLAALFGIVTLLIGFDKIIAIVTQGAPVSSVMLQPAIPFIVYLFIGMVATTACSPSGKNYWILQSLPIEPKAVAQGKMLFQMYLSVPFTVFATLCLCISAKTSFVHTLLYLILGVVLCAFSACWGCVCGLGHMRLDWENEVEVIKQSAAVAIYMFPNMFADMGLAVLVVFLGLHMDHALLTILLTGIVSGLTVLCYRWAVRLAESKA